MKRTHKVVLSRKFDQGFTLIELMIVVVVISILVAIATVSYQQFVKRSVAAQAQQEIAKLSEQLERHKSRNFSYKGFDASYLYTGGVNFNVGTQTLDLSSTYSISIVDGVSTTTVLTHPDAVGNQWAIKAESIDPDNFTYLLTSKGLRCKNKAKALVTYIGCGTGGGEW